MTNTFLKIHRHIKHHHKKYLFGIFGGFAVMKLFLLILWLSVVEYTHNSTYAQLATWCTLTGQYYTWTYETWWYLTGQTLTWWILTGGYLTGCTSLSGYWTWGSLDESGTLTWQTRVEDSQTGCELTGQYLFDQVLTWGYMTWYYTTWGYRTWGYITWCISQTWTNNQTWTFVSWWNGICESWDIIWNGPISWSVVSNIFPITWTYSWTDCLVSWLSIQLRDHNSQRINLSTWLSLWTTWYLFDSKKLYSFQQSGFYHIIWTGTSGQFYLYTGIATWTYSRLFSWYKIRLFTSSQTLLYETLPFTINNELSVLIWMSLVSSWSTTWYVNASGIVNLSFTSSKPLSWLQVTLWSGKIANSSTISWLLYTYTRNMNSWYSEGPLAATIVFTDAVWTTGVVLYTWSLVFDKTSPVVTWFVFSGYSSWVYLNFSWSEPVRYTIAYQKTWWTFLSGIGADYLTAYQLNLSWIERDQLYMFTLNIYDRANNSRVVTGDVLQTTLWTILSHIYVASLSGDTWLTSTLASLAVVLKSEIGKFTACKNAVATTPVELSVRNTTFILHMPLFKNSQIKILVNAFTLFVLDKVKHNYSMTSENITEMTKKFDNFLIVLKLLRDDDNICKQNLSTYHIGQFKKSLEEFNIRLE